MTLYDVEIWTERTNSWIVYLTIPDKNRAQTTQRKLEYVKGVPARIVAWN